MKDEKKQQCVICHKDITNELPKIDIYGNHYCKDCYIEKCKYELMNMRDTILINKELLKRELQFLEEQTQKHTRKETAKEIIDMLIPNCEVCDENWHKGCLCLRATIAEKIAKQYGVEVENDV